MTLRTLTILAVFAVAGGGSAALGQDTPAGAAEDFAMIAFEMADRDGNALVDEAELAADAIAGFVSLDADGSGAIEAAEAGPEGLGAANADGDGSLTLEELMALKMAQMQAADTDGDGALSLDEVLAHERGVR